jgi:hypothetical protein
MSKQEQAFWEIWNKIEPHAETYNHRMMFDLGYEAAIRAAREAVKQYICYEQSKEGNCPHGACAQLTDVFFELGK